MSTYRNCQAVSYDANNIPSADMSQYFSMITNKYKEGIL